MQTSFYWITYEHVHHVDYSTVHSLTNTLLVCLHQRLWPAARAIRNRQTKDGFDRRGEAEAVWRGLRHHPGSHQSEVLFHWPPCECYLSTRKYVWKVLPFISCWCSECHCEGISHAEQGKAQDGAVSDLWESWIKACCGALALYQVIISYNLQETFSETVWVCWTFS